MMRSMEDKEISGSAVNFEFHKANGTNRASNSHHHHRSTSLGKPAPSKWDDAQKWLMGLSRGADKNYPNTNQPRNSNADDRRLIAPVPQKEKDYPSSKEEGASDRCQGPETKNVDCDGPVWRLNSKDSENSSAMVVRSVCVRDMGTEMTPIASQEPSRTATPIRASTPISSGSSTPVRSHQRGSQVAEVANPGATKQCGGESGVCKMPENNDSLCRDRRVNTLETRAMAWDEAERAKYLARYKREEVKIQAWENHEKRKAEMEMKRLEAKAERLKARAQERLANKLAATRRIAEEKRANAEAKLNEKAAKTSETADYIKRTGHMPSAFSIKLPSLCCW